MASYDNMSASEAQRLAKQGDRNALQALYSKAVAFDDQGRHEEAIKWYDIVLEIAPNTLFVIVNKAAALVDSGRYAEAIRCYDKALELDPNNSQVREAKKVAQAKAIR